MFFENKRVLQKDQGCNTGTELIRSPAHVGGAHGEAVYLRQKQSRAAHPEKGVGVLADEECTRGVIYIAHLGAIFRVCLVLWRFTLLI